MTVPFRQHSLLAGTIFAALTKPFTLHARPASNRQTAYRQRATLQRMIRTALVRARNLLHRFTALEDAVASIHKTQSDDQSVAARTSHRLFEVGGVVDDVRAIVGDTLPHLGRLDDERHGRLLDAVNYSTRRQPLTRERTRVLFLVHHIEAWDSLDALVRALDEAPDFDVVVASIPRRFRGSDGPVDEELIHAGLSERGVRHLRITQESDEDRLNLVRSLTPDIIFRQSQWDDDVPEAFSTRNLAFARLCLVPYETMSIIENPPIEGVGNTAIDNHFHRTAWRVFCANNLVKEAAARDGARGGEQFVVTGHPKADRLRSAAPRWPITHETGSAPRARVIWSAHHSINDEWTGFGLAHLVADDMLAWAESIPDVDFVLMPHPALRPFINDPASPITPEQADRFVEQWTALPNAAVFANGDYAPVLAASDVMIVDGLSMLVEYQFQSKPLIFLERPGHRPFNAIGEIAISGTHAVTSVLEARAIVDAFLGGQVDSLAHQQRLNTEQLFGTDTAVERIVAELRAAIKQDRIWPQSA